MQTDDEAEPRARYYSEDTPLEEIEETLSGGGFTGYVELSENVLSGDYYLVYHGGEARAVAFIGTRSELVTGTAAREQMADEVGIYRVITAPVDVRTVPDSMVPDGDGGSMDDAPQPGTTAPEAQTEASKSDDGTGSTTQAEGPGETGPDGVAERGAATERAGGDHSHSEDDLEAQSAAEPDREALVNRIQELEAELAALREGEDSSAARDPPEAETTQMDPATALAETEVFVRYETKADPTLKDVTDDADQATVAANVGLEMHTRFDPAAVQVQGDSVREFLEGTDQWRLAEWLVTTLPFEIRDSENTTALAALYEALPQVDRCEFATSLADDDATAGEYDVVCRDRTGSPLIVADIHAQRAPVDGAAVETFVEKTSDQHERTPSVVAGLIVTRSFFAPDALTAADSATGGGC
ncbi:MAG: hypothetical protein ABEJ35_07500 [Halobacteriaceae archaeon]